MIKADISDDKLDNPHLKEFLEIKHREIYARQ